MSAAQIVIEMDALADRVARMRAVGRNGDLDPFYMDRSQVEIDLRRLAQWLSTGRRPGQYELAADRGRADEARTRYSQR